MDGDRLRFSLSRFCRNGLGLGGDELLRLLVLNKMVRALLDKPAGCAFSHHGATIKVRFSTQPVPLERFELTVTAPNATKISAEFQMVGMDMGFNRYDFRPQGAGIWQAAVTLPVCTVNRVDWIAELDLDGKLYQIRFVTLK